MKTFFKSLIFLLIIAGSLLALYIIPRLDNNSANNKAVTELTADNTTNGQNPGNTELVPADIKVEETNPMAIKSLRDREYLGGDFVIEKKLANGTNYQQFIASYQSEGLKIFGLLTVPLAEKPKNGFPAIVFVHGYIQPDQYSTTGNYPTYQARLARSGFITFKPDLRGHGNSEGEAVSAHYSEKYVVDTLYAIAYLKKYKEVDANRIGYWGHSNGGEIGLRVVVISPDIKAASFWAGVVGSQKDMIETYNDKIGFMRDATSTDLVLENGLPSENPDFWNKLDPYAFLSDITAPIQLQHGTADDSVPIELSLHLKEELEKLNKSVEYYEYDGDNHNISNNVGIAFQRTIDFYNDNLK
jgi:dipeptidyl aminopeptidase/acylaminoacyl peptidase